MQTQFRAMRPPFPPAGCWIAPVLSLQTAGQGIDSEVLSTWPFPIWLTVLLLLSGGAYILLIYFLERGTSLWALLIKLLLAGVRLLLLCLVVFLLHGWMRHAYTTDLPDLVVVVDDSASMSTVDGYDDAPQAAKDRVAAAGFGDASRINLAKAILLEEEQSRLKELRRRYNLKVYYLGASARAAESGDAALARELRGHAAEGAASRLGSGLRDILEGQRGRPTAAVVLFTDGATTEGATIGDVASYARRKSIPLFPVGLGSETPRRDVRLTDLLAEEAVFVGDVVNFDFRLSGNGYEGQTAAVRLRRRDSDEVLAEETVKLPVDGEAKAARLVYRPTEKGEFEYVVEAVPLEGEENIENNRQSQTVLVSDATIRVLLVQAQPSYEYRYLKQLLGREQQGGAAAGRSIDLDVVLQESDDGFAAEDEDALRGVPVSRDELFAYDVILFGDVDPARISRPIQENIADFVRERGGGVVFLSGPRYTPLAYRSSPLAELFPINLDSARQPQPGEPLTRGFRVLPTRLGLSTPQMLLADDPSSSERDWRSLPEIYWMVEAPDVAPSGRVLAVHPALTGGDGRNLPLIVLHFVGAGKVIFHATDETWRWRFRVGDAHFARYWQQTIRYLGRSKLDRGATGAVLTTDREEYRRGDPVRLRVRFSTAGEAPAADDGVSVVVERDGGKRQNVLLTRDQTNQAVFEGTVDHLPEGSYRARVAFPTFSGAPPSRRFTVVAPPGEQTRLEMEADDLKRAARISEGRFYTLADADELFDDLPAGKQVRISALPPEPAWNWWGFALAFIVLISAEWSLRKWAGML